MTNYTKNASYVLLISLLAGLVFLGVSTPRDIRDELKDVTASQEILATTALTSFTSSASDFCMRWMNSGDAADCTTSPLVVELVWPRRARVETLQVVIYGIGDANYECDVDILIGDAGPTGAVQLELDNNAVNALVETTQSFTISKGDVVTIAITDGDDPCEGTADPDFTATLLGRWL